MCILEDVNILPKVIIIDVDGVMTDGKFYYGEQGKLFKAFGADDHDALLLMQKFIKIHFVTGDKKGFQITKKRIQEDMKMPLDLVSTIERIEWIKLNFEPNTVIYIGDGIFDPLVFKEVMYSICPSNGFYKTKAAAKYVTQCAGGDRAVAEACFHILETFFPGENFSLKLKEGEGEWGL